MSLLLTLSALLLASADTQAAPVAEEKDPIICEGREASTVGTRMRKKRVCMRKSAWDYQKKHTQRELQQINNRGDNRAPVGARAGGAPL